MAAQASICRSNGRHRPTIACQTARRRRRDPPLVRPFPSVANATARGATSRMTKAIPRADAIFRAQSRTRGARRRDARPNTNGGLWQVVMRRVKRGCFTPVGVTAVP